MCIKITCSRSVEFKTVFDLYPQEPTTKDLTHLHRTQRACTKIRVANDTVLDLTKPQFLSNSDNKQRLVDYLALKLANIPGIEYVEARDNADCLIIDTALLAAAEYLRCVTVVGDDTDLIDLLLHKTKDIELNTAQLFFRTKNCTVTSLFLLQVLGKSRS